jgi:hypothetical protein
MRSLPGTSWARNALAGTLLALVVCGLSSCGGAGPTTVPVRGKITLAGGAWPQAGTLYFTPVKPATGMPHRAGTAEFATDGSFRVSTYRPHDGLVPGEYSVNIECWEVPPSPGDPHAAKSLVPGNYHALLQSQLPVVIPLDARGTVQVTLDVPKS